jgi:hypothetical protein
MELNTQAARFKNSTNTTEIRMPAPVSITSEHQ